MKPGDLRMFQIGRNPITRDINWVLGLILEVVPDVVPDDDPILDRCKVLTCDGIVKHVPVHGSRGIADETG